MNVRLQAVNVLLSVTRGSSLTDALIQMAAQTAANTAPSSDQAFLKALCYGVCRHFFKLESIAAKLLSKPLKSKDYDIYLLILVGLYQLIEMHVPEYAAVAETVAVADKLKKIWAKGLVNAILREYLRQAENINQRLSLEEQLSHPQWMLEKIKQDYPDQWQEILEANNQHPPFSLRVNTVKITMEEYLKKLKDLNIALVMPAEVGIQSDRVENWMPASAGMTTVDIKTGIIIKTPMDVNQLPGFSEGEVSVQDGAAQLAAGFLQLKPNQRVLDACAAPGGKTAHILETQNHITCVAVEQNPERMQKVKETLQRLKFSPIKLIVADAGSPDKWWDGIGFDRILLDAPCSASGVIRRHPDIKLLRKKTDILNLAREQLRLLNALWPLLNKNGILLYCTCSIFKEENSEVIKQFLDSHPDAHRDEIEYEGAKNCEIGIQIVPGMNNMDGFYYARLRK